MKSKICSKCGWEYPYTSPLKKCRFCKEPFTSGVCTKCGKFVEGKDYKKNSSLCRSCHHKRYYDLDKDKARAKDNHKKSVDKVEKEHTDWIEHLVPIHSLTEQEWLEACAYFGGCAYCNNEDISTRSYFIAFKNGGKYAANNIVPACEECATERKTQLNPFKRANKRLIDTYATYRGVSPEKLAKCVEYLEGRNVSD